MRAGQVTRIELGVDAVAASVLAAAAAWSATRLSLAALSAAGVAAFAWCCSLALLRAVSARGRFRLAAFDLAGVPAPPEELVLTDTDLLSAQPPERSPELLLDDVLAQLGPDSRVVRLFDPAAMPTPGELRARIDRHLDSSARPMPEADASQALHEALAELRRSLR